MSNVETMKELRRRACWNQYDLADWLGVQQTTVSRIESGEVTFPGPVGRALELLALRLDAGEISPKVPIRRRGILAGVDPGQATRPGPIPYAGKARA